MPLQDARVECEPLVTDQCVLILPETHRQAPGRRLVPAPLRAFVDFVKAAAKNGGTEAAKPRKRDKGRR